MKIISYNANGIRSVINKGFKDFIKEEDPDIICIQEVKLPIDYENDNLDISGYNYAINYSGKNGYSGVLCYFKESPLNIVKSINLERFDSEGRILVLEYKSYVLLNVYMPHGGRKKENLDYKLEAFNKLNVLLKVYKNKEIILLGDFNIAHTFDDAERSKQNVNNIMFTEQERKEITNIVNKGFIDTFREFNKEKGNYTWFPYAFDAKNRNVGWRIDYCFISKKMKSRLVNSYIRKEISCSDHCPIIVELR